MTRRRTLFATFAIVGSAAVMSAQNPTFSSRVDVVRIDALVTDGRGQPISGLTASDFEVADNGVSQEIGHVLAEQLPLNVVLALDLSGSVAGEQANQLRMASHAVIDALTKGDKAALVTFSASVLVRARLTSDLASVRGTLDQQTAGFGDTALVDASYASMLLAEADDARGLVIVFSDGADTRSFLTPASVLETAQRLDSVVYAASVGTSPPTPFLRELCNRTAGRVFKVESMAKLREAFLEILDEFRHRYLISYTPQGVATDGWHRLELRVKNRHATVKARPGYVAGS